MNVLNVRSRADLNMNNGDNNPQLTAIEEKIRAIQEQMTTLQNSLQVGLNGVNSRLDNVNGRLDIVSNRLALVEARVLVDRARAFNNMNLVRPVAERTFQLIVKHVVGHPRFRHLPEGVRRLDNPQLNVVLAPPQGGYPLGSNPPVGLMPSNNAELLALGRCEHADLRLSLRAIYWFYNNPELQLAAQAGLNATLASFDALSSFLMDI